jgi:hypothetical protein
MNFLLDEMGQGAAEYILLFGGVIIIAILSLLIYKQYFPGNKDLNTGNDMDRVRKCTQS